MKYELDLLEKAHSHSIFHKNEILGSRLCGCFSCIQIFKPEEITEWTDNDNPKGLTALCPYCGIDSVIGDKSGYQVSDEDFLKAMYQRWFS